MSTQTTDTQIAIIGGGVIGCALAAKLAVHFHVTLIERNPAVAQETSRRNSGVIHSGIHLVPGSNKAQLARRGKTLVEEYCRRHAVPCFKVGMHIVVARQDLFGLWPEWKRLGDMLKRAKDQGIAVQFVSGRTIRQREPHIQALFGLHIPDVSIISAVALTERLHQEASLLGAMSLFDQTVTGLDQIPGGWKVTTNDHELKATCVINAAGLYADQVAALAGFQYRQYFYRGEYYRVQSESGLRLNGLIYPVHQPGKPGLGVHLTRTVNGELLIGPNAKRVNGPTDYQADPTPPEAFYNDVKSFLPGLDLLHLSSHPAGIRPKLSDGKTEDHFLIVWESAPTPFLNLIGIESPGLTAAMAIAADTTHELLHKMPF